jgi:hypothetical protein
MDQCHTLLHISTAGLSERLLHEIRYACISWFTDTWITNDVTKSELNMRLVQVTLELQVRQGKRTGEGL